MKGLPEERTTGLAQYMIEENATVRQTAARFGVSKSTVHKDITTRLKTLNAVLYERVQEVLRTNKQERHIRGGMATREKYRVQAEERRHGGAIKNRLSAGQPGDGYCALMQAQGCMMVWPRCAPGLYVGARFTN